MQLDNTVLRHLRAAIRCGSRPAATLLNQIRLGLEGNFEWNTTYGSQPRIFRWLENKLQVIGKEEPWGSTLRLAETSVTKSLKCHKIKGYYGIRQVLDPANWTMPPELLTAKDTNAHEWAKALAAIHVEVPIITDPHGIIGACFILTGCCCTNNGATIDNARVAYECLGDVDHVYDLLLMHAKEWAIDAIAPQKKAPWRPMSTVCFTPISNWFPKERQKANFYTSCATCVTSPPPFLSMYRFVDFTHEEMLWVDGGSYLPDMMFNRPHCHECGKPGRYPYGVCSDCVRKKHTCQTVFGRFMTEPPSMINGEQIPRYCLDENGNITTWYKLYRAIFK